MSETIVNVPSVEFWPPPVQPGPGGLLATITASNAWEETGPGPDRFSIGGVNIRTINYGGAGSSGVWTAPWCGDPDPTDQVKTGERPDFPDPFLPFHVWAFDACDETQQSRDYVRENAVRWLTLQESDDVERAFATRLLNDAGSPTTSTSLLDALGQLEVAIAATSVPGFIHASPYLMPYLANVFAIDPYARPALKTHLGDTWIFGSGYSDSLDMTLVATSQPYGWRGDQSLTEAMYAPSDGTNTNNQFVALAERSFAIGYEKLIAAVTVTLP
jgi:hypothetical protein